MIRPVNATTLFHLVPANEAAHDALLHPDNSRFVSASAAKGQLGRSEPGLEIGFHVPSISSGRVITRIGRDADLILPGRPISKVHVAFEIHPETLVVLLSVRSKHLSSVKVASLKSEEQKLDGDCVIIYGQDYRITIVSYEFELIWREIKSPRDLAIQGYKHSLERLQDVRSRDLPTEFDESKVYTWYDTRLHTARKGLFREAEGVPRVLIGRGQFGEVFRTVDLESGNPLAVKVVRLDRYTDVEQARAALHREVKALERLKHKNIVECLCTAKWNTLAPEIFMPLRPGHLRSLTQAKNRLCTDDSLCMQVLEQILSALDHLAHHSMCHRDVKPENILYWDNPGQRTYSFQLADFGLVNHQRYATTFCGTGYYQAPELYPEYGRFPQSPKMDVWSLFATVIDVHPKLPFPPRHANSYGDVLQAVRAVAVVVPALGDMARENPAHRASAAQLLVAHYGGQGLTTPRAAVPPIRPRPGDAVPGESRPSKDAPKSVAQVPVEAVVAQPLIVYPTPHRRRTQEARPSNVLLPKPSARPPKSALQPIRARRDGIAKPRGLSTQLDMQKLAEEQLEKEPARRQPDKEPARAQVDKELCIPGRFPV